MDGTATTTRDGLDVGQLGSATEEQVELTPEQKEMHWYLNVYRGDTMPQLTLRAVLMGSMLGGLMSLSNLYVGLKTGWGLGVAITSCILSFAIWRSLHALFPRLFRTEMTILENNCMQSTASSAGYSTGGTMVSAIAAYLIVTGHHIPFTVLMLWTFFLATLGVFMAIPMKRQMINVEQLRFPSGIAAAETLQSLHAKGDEASSKAKSLGFSALFGSIITGLRDLAGAIPAAIPLPGTIKGFALGSLTLSFEMSAIMIAAGAIVGWKMAWSMLFGGIVNYTVLAPEMISLGAIDPSKLGYRAIMSWATWPGAAMLVTSGLFYFAIQWKSVARAFRGMGSVFSRKKDKGEQHPIERVEVPASWFMIGTVVSGLACMWLLWSYFGTTPIMGVLAVVLTFFLALVACRATGESDITPIGAMGKITQLTYGVLAPSNMVTNLMTASVTAGAASSSADLLTDLKSGYMLGANPRRQFWAQFLGVFAGCAVVVPAFYLLVPDAASLGTDRWPAPSAQIWAAVAKLLSTGIGSLHPAAQAGLIIGGLVGIAIPVLEMILPKKARPFIPSPTGLGLAMVIPFANSLSMFIGAAIALALTKTKPNTAAKYIIPVASGIIAGESLMGIVVALLQAGGVVG